MPNTEKQTAAAQMTDRDVLKGPPGLLLGLTLLVFVAARLCFGWDTPSASDSGRENTARKSQSVAGQSVAPSDDAPLSLAARGDVVNLHP
jgi:hypothetical protein